MQPTPGATKAPISQGLTLAEHQAIRAIGLQPTPGPWRRIEWTRHAATTLVVPDATAATGLRVVAEFETESDAALAEAAPDLLECLRDWFADYAEHRKGGEADELVRRSRMAMRKATRGTHE